VGKLSTIPTFVSGMLLELVIVIVKVLDPPSGTVEGLKLLVADGGATTVMVAVLDASPAPLSVALIGSVVLFCTPAVTPVTTPPKVQVVPPAKDMLASTRCVEVDPPVAKGPQLFGVVRLTVNPAGKVSLKDTLSRVVGFGLKILKVRDWVPFSGTVAAPKLFTTMGGATVTDCTT